MKKLLKIVLPILVLIAGALGAKALVDSRPKVVPEPIPVVLPTVRTIQVEQSNHRVLVQAQGTVVPRTESDLVVEVAGRITAVSPALVSGGFFEAGEVLLEIDGADYELALAQAKLGVAQAERRLAEVEADAEVARREWEELGEGEPSPLTLHEPQLAEARASLEAARAAKSRAERDLERTKITADYAGRVRSKAVDLGQYVMPGTPVARVYAIDAAEVRLPLPDSELAFLELPSPRQQRDAAKSGSKVTLSADFGGQRHSWGGRIVRSEGEIDPRTRMVVVVARIEDPYGLQNEQAPSATPLTVGMFVDAKIEGRLLESVFVLPRSALRSGPQLYRLDEEDRLHRHAVELIRSGRDEVLLRGEGLFDGMRVVSTPLEVVTEGMRVRDLSAPAN